MSFLEWKNERIAIRRKDHKCYKQIHIFQAVLTPYAKIYALLNTIEIVMLDANSNEQIIPRGSKADAIAIRENGKKKRKNRGKEKKK